MKLRRGVVYVYIVYWITERTQVGDGFMRILATVWTFIHDWSATSIYLFACTITENRVQRRGCVDIRSQSTPDARNCRSIPLIPHIGGRWSPL